MKSRLVIIITLFFTLAIQAFFTDSALGEQNNQKILRVALTGFGDIPTLDPARAAIAAPVVVGWQVYQRLVDVTPDGGITPMLATHWSSNHEMTIWRFSLREDVYFHSSSPEKRQKLSVQDVKGSLERALLAPGYGRAVIGDLVQGAQDFIEKKVATVVGITTSGNDIVFTLIRPFAFFPQRLAASFFAIVPADTEMEDGSPAGTGPYRITEWDRLNGKVTLQLNPQTWADISPQSPRQLIFQIFENESLAVEELRAGKIDWLEASSSARQLVTQGIDPQRYSITTPLHNDIRLIAFNQTLSRFKKHPELAIALNFAVKRDHIVYVLGGGRAVGGPVPGGEYGHYGYWTDERLARRLIDTLPPAERHLELLVMPGTESRIIAELVAKDWRAAGLDVSLQQGMSDFFDRVVKGNYEAALGYFGPFINTPEQYLWPYQDKAQPVPNVMRYESVSFQKAYQKYVAEPDESKQLAYLQGALDILLRDAPMVWLVKAPHIVAAKGSLSAPRTSGMPLFFKMKSE